MRTSGRTRQTHCREGHDLSLHGVFRGSDQTFKCRLCERAYHEDWSRRHPGYHAAWVAAYRRRQREEGSQP